MSFRTTCPHCSSLFRLGPDQLDAAQGWVQCGVCGGAFDARASLQMEDGSPLEAAPAVPPPPAERVADAPQAAAEDVPPDEPPSPAPAPAGIAQRESESGLSSIIIIDPDIPVPDDFGAMPQFDATPAPAAPPPLMYPPPYSAAPPIPAVAPVTAAAPASPRMAADEPPELDVFAEPEPRSKGAWAWAAASVLLLALLLAQSAYFLRDALVSHFPQARPALERMCAVAGCTLSLPRNLKLLQIVGSDLQTEADGRLKLSLTLGNRAAHAQAWPVLVLTLNDQHNRPLARRSFAPSEYLGDAERIAAGMPPRSEQALSLPLAVNGLKPMGFDLQLVY